MPQRICKINQLEQTMEKFEIGYAPIQGNSFETWLIMRQFVFKKFKLALEYKKNRRNNDINDSKSFPKPFWTFFPLLNEKIINLWNSAYIHRPVSMPDK